MDASQLPPRVILEGSFFIRSTTSEVGTEIPYDSTALLFLLMV